MNPKRINKRVAWGLALGNFSKLLAKQTRQQHPKSNSGSPADQQIGLQAGTDAFCKPLTSTACILHLIRCKGKRCTGLSAL